MLTAYNRPPSPPNDNQRRLSDELNAILAKFKQELSNLAVQGLEISTIQTGVERLRSEISATVQQDSVPNLVEINKRLVGGEFDDIIFTAPEMTREINALLQSASYRRNFIQRLFTKCNSIETLNFWFDKNKVPLTNDVVALAVALGNNIHVLTYLNQKGYFENISNIDKDELIARAERFNNPGLEFLKSCLLKTKTSPTI